MRKLIAVLATLALTLALGGPALAADGDLTHSGRVLIGVGGDVSLPVGEEADAVVVVDGHATVAGEANNVIVIDGTATITGTTIENLLVVRGSAEVVDTSVVYDIRTLDAQVEQVNVDLGGSVKGLDAELIGLGWIVGSALFLIWIGIGLATIVAGLLLAGLAARQVRSAGRLIGRQPGSTAVAGLLALVVPPIVAVLAMITIVGIPIGFSLLLFVWPTLAFIGYLVAAIWLGQWVLAHMRGQRDETERPYFAAVVGLLITLVLGFVPLFTAVISFVGLGAVTLLAWRTLRGGGAPQPAFQPQVAAAAG
jgi:hypothetical protein